MLLRIDLYYTWVQLLHLCLPQVPLKRNPDPWSEFGLRGNKTFSLLGGIIFPFIPVCEWSEGHMRKLRLTLLRSKMKKEFPLFVCGDAHQVHDYIGGRDTFALKRGKKWNSPKLILFHKCFSALRGRISSLLPKCAGQNYVTWHALHDCTESWFTCGSSTVVFVHCRGGKWNCYSYKFKFFIHFLLEVFPRNLLRSSVDS